jgi:hypothetical protein
VRSGAASFTLVNSFMTGGNSTPTQTIALGSQAACLPATTPRIFLQLKPASFWEEGLQLKLDAVSTGASSFQVAPVYIQHNPVTVAGMQVVGAYASFAIIAGRPAIAFYDATNGDLKFVRSADVVGKNWGTPITVDRGIVLAYPITSTSARSDVGQAIQLIVVTDPGTQIQYPAIFYWDATKHLIKYIRSTAADGSTWPTVPVIVDPNANAQFMPSELSAAIIDGSPAVLYRDSTADLSQTRVCYVRATDPLGAVTIITPAPPTGTAGTAPPANITSPFGPVVVLEGPSDLFPGFYPNLCECNINGSRLPVAVWNRYDSTSTFSPGRITVGNDAAFSTFGSYNIVSNTSNMFFLTMVQLPDGTVVIMYADNDGILKVTRSTNASLSSFSTPVQVYDLQTLTVQAAFATYLVNGKLAVVVRDANSGVLMYGRSRDSAAQVWEAPTPLVSSASVSKTGLCLTARADGCPSVCYQDAATGTLCYIASLPVEQAFDWLAVCSS